MRYLACMQWKLSDSDKAMHCMTGSLDIIMTEDNIACYSDKGWLLSDIYIHHILSTKINIYILTPETMLFRCKVFHTNICFSVRLLTSMACCHIFMKHKKILSKWHLCILWYMFKLCKYEVMNNFKLWFSFLALKGPVPYIYGTHQCGSTHLRHTRAELVPHCPRSWPALEPQICPIAGRRKLRFNREVSEPRLCQEPQATFPIWVPRFKATGLRYTSRKSCVHTFMPYSTCLIGNIPMCS